MKKSVLDLEFRLFRTEQPGSCTALRDSAYDLWKRNWNDTFRELGVNRKLDSDDFLHRELGGLFQDERAVGFLLYHQLDLRSPVYHDVSYFENYPEDIRLLQCQRRDSVMVITYMTLEPEWRKEATDLPISELLIGFSVLRFLETRANRLIGYFRNNRKTNEMFYRHGGLPLMKNRNAYNVSVDFAEINRESARLSSRPHCAGATLQLWNRNQKGENSEDTSRLRIRNASADSADRILSLDRQEILW